MTMSLYLRSVVKVLLLLRLERGPDGNIRAGWQTLEVSRPSHDIITFEAETDEAR
jgi:hypothetical protein